MKSFHIFSGQEKGLQLADRVLSDCLKDPELAKIFENMLADQTMTKRELFHTAFAQGVISTLIAIKEGRLLFNSEN